jgi:hypothetical protein
VVTDSLMEESGPVQHAGCLRCMHPGAPLVIPQASTTIEYLCK